ncbi:hypothetical protein SAMN05216184_10352 [Georgenia satyanarayanai]|uniref:Uncharacterized protein n=1 Tax=Georgenia satyanarayanai TaxID=860221 RepID=A0A2Y9A606_9MICO|nr:hypothetical protein [Georgenia satyanarayanai]PYG00482.1 hypothetical protein A8987_10352 [Georgenia satyanarayanai]SSA39871.1 hypothetical protein SAMN05216184_10352 [Georgenia satyanarayanai]
MERLTGEARDRVRASSLTLVAALTLVGVAVGLWAVFVGFERTTVVDSEVVAVSEDGRRVTVRYSYGGCQRADGVEAHETEETVVVAASVTERRPLVGQDCQAVGVIAEEEVVLTAPLGDRELRTATP